MNDFRYPRGYVQIGKESFGVDSVLLNDGGVIVTFTMRGPVTVEGPLTFFGADGLGCWQGRAMERATLARGDTWTCSYKLRLDEIRDGEKGLLDVTGT